MTDSWKNKEFAMTKKINGYNHLTAPKKEDRDTANRKALKEYFEHNKFYTALEERRTTKTKQYYQEHYENLKTEEDYDYIAEDGTWGDATKKYYKNYADRNPIYKEEYVEVE